MSLLSSIGDYATSIGTGFTNIISPEVVQSGVSTIATSFIDNLFGGGNAPVQQQTVSGQPSTIFIQAPSPTGSSDSIFSGKDKYLIFAAIGLFAFLVINRMK
jgi:hypothetical protein